MSLMIEPALPESDLAKQSPGARLAIGAVAGAFGAVALSAFALVLVAVRGAVVLQRYGYTLPRLVLTYFALCPMGAVCAVLWPWASRRRWRRIVLGGTLGAIGIASVALPMQPFGEWLDTLPWYLAGGALMGAWASRPDD
jgi:hypothetical protein